MIHIQKLTKSYGDTEVLRGVDLTVHAGDILALIGPSGSGKSTLIRCLNGLEAITSGDAEVAGIKVVPENFQAVRRQAGMVFQHFYLFPHRRAWENIAEAPIHVRGLAPALARERAFELLRQVGLEGLEERYPAELSGGQQQRVAIARALAMDPEVMLFDEVTSALDPEMVGEVLGVLRDLAARGMTMIIVTHEMDFARQVASHVGFLEAGVLRSHGPPAELLDAPEDPRLGAFLGALSPT